jgi:hypothetical protein
MPAPKGTPVNRGKQQSIASFFTQKSSPVATPKKTPETLAVPRRESNGLFLSDDEEDNRSEKRALEEEDRSYAATDLPERKRVRLSDEGSHRGVLQNGMSSHDF